MSLNNSVMTLKQLLLDTLSTTGGELNHEKLEKENELVQPVRLQPSWEDNDIPEHELNFKRITMNDASLKLKSPPDHYKLVYLTFLLHGIGVLMPWNMFITAGDYFKDHKLKNSPELLKWFFPCVTAASQIPNVILNWLNIFVQIGGDITTRVVWSICIEVLMFILTIALAMFDSSNWTVTFFCLTMIIVVITNMATGVYQNTLFGMAAKLPIKYTGAVVLGSNISGTFTSIVNIVSAEITSTPTMSAIYYFIMALFVLLICFDTYFALPLNRFYRHFEMKNKPNQSGGDNCDTFRTRRPPYSYIFKKSLPQLYNIFIIFFVTLSIFPAVQTDIKRSHSDFIVPETHYANILCYLTFNISAMIGSFLPQFFVWPKPEYLWIPSSLRLLFIPFFIFANYIPKNSVRLLPVLISNDWLYWFGGILMGLTSGYFSSLGMMYAPRTVEPQYAATAGMFGAAALVTGIFSGVLVTFLWPCILFK